ncbi:Cruciform DNA binding protein [Ophidiomyces ophidiicola]|uniref:Cruciform DNA binding protein n=1 Tax=Ophidiomyces ophidiicola TaxID=1387563 RepID=UPI0020C328DB|nr:Cruciform DNA binding protein [Ophidiomyces ophidiicola]KAI1949755.1 Cruciform DNA binding protein [Ophidiomyces ophidiicola]KAI2056248.1 Cruciform DNA binding protein [Ophidiomyces ophidiicola]
MGLHTFQWPHPADEVIVTGTFDNWSKSIKLEKSPSGAFRKEVDLPETFEKVLYKFVVDGTWATDHTAPQEDDGHHNVNNVLFANKHSNTAPRGVAVMSGVTPEATTAGLAGKVPLESDMSNSAQRRVSQSEISGPGAFTMSSLAPDSTTAELAKEVPLEPTAGGTPGGFPETPGPDESVSVNPIPATNGIGNPINLQPGEKVPNVTGITNNTIASGVTTDIGGYERDASDPSMAALAANQGTIGDKPVQISPAVGGAVPVIQSAAPESTTSALAANVPLEKSHALTHENSHEPADEVPDVVKKSLSEAHQDAEAAGFTDALEEKKEVEQELLRDVKRDDSAGKPAPGPAPAIATAIPAATESRAKATDSGNVSPMTREPAGDSAAPTSQLPQATTATEPTGAAVAAAPVAGTAAADTTAPAAAQTQPQSTAQAAAPPPSQAESAEAARERKKKNRLSGFLNKLKEKLK